MWGSRNWGLPRLHIPRLFLVEALLGVGGEGGPVGIEPVLGRGIVELAPYAVPDTLTVCGEFEASDDVTEIVAFQEVRGTVAELIETVKLPLPVPLEGDT